MVTWLELPGQLLAEAGCVGFENVGSNGLNAVLIHFAVEGIG